MVSVQKNALLKMKNLATLQKAYDA